MENVPNINWRLLAEVVEAFTNGLKYKYVEVPWAVSEKAIRSTFSGEIKEVLSGPLYAVGSAEQSFVELQLQGKLEPGYYITVSPCFREESVHNEFTRPHFMKAEIYITKDASEETAKQLATASLKFFGYLLSKQLSDTFIPDSKKIDLRLVPTDEGWDIMLNGIELGSYGVRTYEGTTWVYGTALAEPRFTAVVNRIKSE